MRRGVLTALVLLAVLLARRQVRVSAAPRNRLCQTDCVTAFPLPAGTAPFGIARGRLDSMWFTHNDAMARIDQRGEITTYPVPTPDRPEMGSGRARRGLVHRSEQGRPHHPEAAPSPSTPAHLAGRGAKASSAAPTATSTSPSKPRNAIARLNPRTGMVREFPIPTPVSTPSALPLGPDGALWFIERTGDKVGRMTPRRHLPPNTRSPPAPFPTGSSPAPTATPWFTELLAGKLGRITTDGRLHRYPIDGGPARHHRRQRLPALRRLRATPATPLASTSHGIVTGRWDLPAPTCRCRSRPASTATSGSPTPSATPASDSPPTRATDTTNHEQGCRTHERPSRQQLSFAGPALVNRHRFGEHCARP